MSSITVTPGFDRPRAGVRRPAGRPAPRPARAAEARAEAAPLRLTRRGRIVVTVLLLGLVLAALTVFGARSAATDEPGTPVKTRTVQVGEGDTLGDLASTAAAPGHVREMVLQIEQLNALPGPALQEGQKIAVPVR
jgi:hypothetical protein